MVVDEVAHRSLGDGVPKPRYRLGLTGTFVVWLIVFAGLVVYLSR